MSARGLRRSVLSGLVAVIATGALSAPAFGASTVGWVERDYFNGEEESDEFFPARISVDGDDGVNNVTISPSGEDFLVSDTSGVTAQEGCAQVSPTSASCPEADFARVRLRGENDVLSADSSLIVAVRAGLGNDSVTGATGPVEEIGQVLIDGQEGDDTIVVEGGRVFGLLRTGSGYGGEGDDTLTGGDTDDSLTGGPGADTLAGGEGDDSLRGDEGKDDLSGGDGSDFLDGDGGSPDTPDATPEDDDLDGGEGDDWLTWSDRDSPVTVDLANPAPDGAEGENDKLTNIENVDTGSGDDTIVAADTGSVISPAGGADTITGGAGADFVFAGDSASDTIAFGGGNDTVSYERHDGRVTVNLADSEPDGPADAGDSLTGVENAIATMDGGDVLIGDEGPNILVALNGKDRIDGAGGDDELYGEGRPADYARGDLDDSPADGPQICECGRNGDRLAGGDGEDLLEGGLDSDTLDGGGGNDKIKGDLQRGLGAGRSGRDIVDYSSRTKGVDASVARGGGEGAESDKYSGIEGIRGGSGDDTLIGRAKKRDRLFGGAGGDTLRGKTGKDRLFGEAGRDRLAAADGQKDRANCGAGRDEFWADEKDKLRGCERRGEGPGPAPAVCTAARASVGCVLPTGYGRT